MKLRILAGFAMAAALWGQPQPAPGDASGRVGRLSFVFGQVSFRPEAVQEWAPATLNLPLSTGDHLWTDRDAQAEVHVGLTAIHLAPETGFIVRLLDDRTFRMALAEGALNVRIPRMNEGETVEVETPYGSFRLLQTGSYRVDVQPEGDYASVVVRSGAAEAIANGQTHPVPAGKRLVLAGKPATLELMEAPPLDPWDEWCAARDEQAERGYERSAEHVSWEISGAAEFADYGDWQSDPDCGWCWVPRNLPSGWAPYRFGHWIWKAPWGWTWVDRAPWGFATHHFGRWARVRAGWAWKPDQDRRHPRFSPAHVAFSHRDGRVSWVPLGPRDIRHRQAITTAAERDFASARPVERIRLIVVDRAPTEFTGRKIEVMPTREALLGGPPAGGPARRRNAEPVAVTPPPPVETPRRADEPRRDAEPPSAEERMRRQAEERRRRTDDEESRRADETRRAEEARRIAERQRIEEGRRAEEHRREAEERRRRDDEESRRQAEQRRRRDDEERQRQADEHRRQEEHRAEEGRRAEEHRRQAEESRRADEGRRQAEESRRAEEHRRQQDQQRQAEESRRLEEGRRAEEHRRQAEESSRQEEHRRTKEARKK
jgi:hypothetical protein